MNANVMTVYNSIILLWICSMYSIGVWLFSSGFVINRKLIDRLSSCDQTFNRSQNQFYATVRTHSTPGCGFTHRYKKAVILVTDGLPYDLNNTCNRHESDPIRTHNIFGRYDNHSKMYKLSAFPLLSTSDSMKSLTAGVLPTFIQIGTNFSPIHMIDDNIINQLKRKSKKITFIAENSMKNLFAKHLFHRCFYFAPNFNGFDINKQILTEINSNDWDVILAQFPTINDSNKVKEVMNTFENIISKLESDSDTVLFIISDISNIDLLEKYSPFVYVFNSESFITKENSETNIHRIDLVPTISLLLGIPIPFSNVGKVISSLFEFPMDCKQLKPSSEFTCHEDIPIIKSLWTSISALRINVAQVQRYLAVYTETSYLLPKVVQRELDELLERYDRQWVLLDYIPSDDKLATVQSLRELQKNYDNYISQVNRQLNLSLASYDVRLIYSGIIVVFLTLTANMTCINYIKSESHVINLCAKILIGLVMGAMTANLINLVNFPFHENSLNDMLFLSAVTSIVVSVGSALSHQFIATKDRVFLYKHLFRNCISLKKITILITLSSLVYAFCDVIIINEQSLTYFFFQSVIILHLIDIGFKKFHSSKDIISGKYLFILAVLLVVSIRLSKELQNCDHKLDSCRVSEIIPQSLESKRQLFAAIFLIIFVYIVTKIISTDQNSEPISIFSTKYIMFITCICLCGHWVLSVSDQTVLKRHLSGNEHILAKSVIYSTLLLFTILFIFPSTYMREQFKSCHDYYSNILALSLTCLFPLLLYGSQNSSIGLIMICIIATLYCLVMKRFGSENSYNWILIWFLIASHGFFITGHHYSIDSIPSDAIVVDDILPLIIPFILSMFSSQILCGISLPLLATLIPNRITKTNKQDSEIWQSINKITMKYIFVNAIIYFCFLSTAALLRNDVMVWKIFAPRYIYQSINFIVSLFSVIIGYLFCMRIYFI